MAFGAVAAAGVAPAADDLDAVGVGADDGWVDRRLVGRGGMAGRSVGAAPRVLTTFRWGLVPSWAKDPGVGNRMINARAETVATKNAYRKAFRKHRCIIPADGFYEWKVVPGQKRKQPMFIDRPDGEPMAFAGLWEVWRDPNDPGRELHSCTVITGPANEKMAEVHDRMPVMLPPSVWDTWLDPEVQDVDLLGTFLVPAPPEVIQLRPVSPEVNNVRNTGPHLLDPFEPEPS